MTTLQFPQQMASRELLGTDLGSITGAAQTTSGGPPCSQGLIAGPSILRFGKSLPLVELFEAFMIAGFVLVCVASANYFTFRNIATILKNEGASPASVNLATAASNSNPVWIVGGLILFVIGVLLYYLHRRVLNVAS